jgi:hypothetical protein
MMPTEADSFLVPGRSPTKSTSENPVSVSGMPWETNSAEGKYLYQPGGDASAAPREAPSAVNVVVIPDVNLPKVNTQPKPYTARERERRERDGSPSPKCTCPLTHNYSACTTSTTSGARRDTRLPIYNVLCMELERRRQTLLRPVLLL